MSRILISLLLCSACIIAQDSTVTDESREQVLSPNVAADSLLANFTSTEQDTSQVTISQKAQKILSGGKNFVLENRKELSIYAGFGVLIYIISEITGEEEKPGPEIGYPPGWPDN